MKIRNVYLASKNFLKFISCWLFCVCVFLPGTARAEVTGTHVDPNNRNKVIICHFPPGNPENVQTISISKNALRTHIDHHNDYDGVCSSQGPVSACPVNTGGEFSFHDPVTIVNKNGGKNHVYRFPSVSAGVDAIVTVLDTVKAKIDTIDKVDGNPSGYYESWQPVIYATDSSRGDHYVDFKIEFVDRGTNTPHVFPDGASFVASGLDVDGPGNASIKEYVGFKGFNRYFLESPDTSNLDIRNDMTDGYTGFITRDGSNLPGVTVTNTDHIVTAEFSNTNVFYYRAGVEINASVSSSSRSRFFSLNFGCITYKDPVLPSRSPGTLRYANSGSGKYKDRILFMDWKNSSLEDGVQDGDVVEFDIPPSSCLANGKITATFSDIEDPNGVAQYAVPTDMKTWVGSGFYKLYDTAGTGEAIYTQEYILKSGQSSVNFGFTVDWEMELNGEIVEPDIFLIDGESTTDNSEQIDATTNGGFWSVVENAQSNLYEVYGLGTKELQITNTEHPRPHDVEGWSPLLLSKGMTTTKVTIKNYNSSPGKEGVAFGLLVPCDHGDAPETYGDAGHAFKEEPISAFKEDLGLKFSLETPFLGNKPPDSELETQSDANALGDDLLTDYYDLSRDGDEDGVTLPYFTLGKTHDISIKVEGDGFLQAWIDWNADGDFDDLFEQVGSDVSASSGTFSLPVTVPDDAKIGVSFARFRFSSQPGITSSGYAKDGEVEDYVISISNAAVCRIDEIPQDVYSTSSLSANSAYLSGATRVFQAKFNNSDWSGQLISHDLITTDKDGNVKSKVWNAADEMSRNKRDIYTYNPDLSEGKPFKWNKLGSQQKADLKNGGNAQLAKRRLQWLKGNARFEGTLFRARDNILGDIIHSNLTFKSNIDNYGYKQLSGVEGSSYAAYLRTKKEGRQSLFVGANDGMLHAFDAEDGTEQFAYIPNEVFPKLAKVSDLNYGCKQEDCLKHEYLVDGPSSLGDAYFDTGSGPEWRSVLLGTLGKGGKGVFALDVSHPENFSSEDVLWELSASQAPDNAGVYADHLGYSLPAASVVRMRNGQWAAIIANGYESASQQAVLFIVDIETGALIKSINTQAGSEDTPNGLSTPTAVDSDGDYIVDTIYAGDLLGNLWAFDVSSTNEDNWVITYGYTDSPEPLFRACEDVNCTKPQVITAAPQVGRNPAGGLMVYFGTGQYFDVEDNLQDGEDPAVNSFYGIHDNGDQVVSRNDLLEQNILQEIEMGADLISRVTSKTEVDFSSQDGWLMNLLTPPSSTKEGERVISQALLREGRLIFTTLTPPQSDCVWGGKSWLMELDAVNGSRLDVIPFDTNNDKEFTALDNVEYEGDNTIISGLQKPSLGVIFSSPAIISHTTRAEGKYVTGTGGKIGMFRESASRFSGRMSWKNLR